MGIYLINRRHFISSTIVAVSAPLPLWAQTARLAGEAAGRSNRYDAVGILHNEAMDRFGKSLLDAVKTQGSGAGTLDFAKGLFLDAAKDMLKSAHIYFPEVVGRRLSHKDIDHALVRVTRARGLSLRRVIGRKLDRTVVDDLEVLTVAMEKLTDQRSLEKVRQISAALAKTYSATEDDIQSQTVLIAAAIARHSAEYWFEQHSSRDGWVAQLARAGNPDSPGRPHLPPPSGGGTDWRWLDRLLRWLRGRDWGHVGEADVASGIAGSIHGFAGGPITILIDGMVESFVGSGVALIWG